MGMRRFLALVLAVLLPLHLAAAANLSVPAGHNGHCDHHAAVLAGGPCGTCAAHAMTGSTACAAHGATAGHHCPHFGTVAAAPAAGLSSAIVPALADPEAERWSFKAIVLDVPLPPPTRLA